MFLSIISCAKRGGANAPFARFAATSATTARPARAARRSSSTFTKYKDIFDTFGIERKGNPGVYNGKWCGSGEIVKSINPVTNEVIAEVVTATPQELQETIAAAKQAYKTWRNVPAPKRGDIVRQMREKLHHQRHALGALVSLEVGKIKAEGLGEVQEFIDIADYAVGLSRMLNGQVIPSERPGHFMMEQFHPLGVVGVISAFNFPSAVHGWNVALALVTGNATVWKPHQSTPLISIAQTKVLGEVLEANGLPGALCSLACGGSQIGQRLVDSHDVNLISFTGSTNTGRKVGVSVQKRFGKLILELGGNNAMIVMEDANIEMALKSLPFAAVGTAGQRCTTTRRLFLQSSIYDKFLDTLGSYYGKIRIGDPLDDNILCGPLQNPDAVRNFEQGIKDVLQEGGKILYGGKVLKHDQYAKGNFVMPAITEVQADMKIVQREIFGPILHVMKFDTIEEAIQMNNQVSQGLSSTIFTQAPKNIFKWVSAAGSDCGIVNVNIPTNGAEIGGAFGGEKETGGGRESGSDSWKQYCRRMTSTINYSDDIPLAQGITFTL